MPSTTLERKEDKGKIKKKSLQQEYEKVTRLFDNDPNDLNKARLKEIKEKTNGIIIRARARWHEHGERSSKYFWNLEKKSCEKT